jgi:hypothetical protein
MGGEFIKRFVAIALVLAIPCQAYTYWVDPSCSARPIWQKAIDEAFDMAKKSSRRLASPTDTDYAAVFKRIFKVDKRDNTLFPKYENDSPDFRSPDQTAYDFVQGKSSLVIQIMLLLMTSIGILGDINTNKWVKVDGSAGRPASDIRFYCDNGIFLFWFLNPPLVLMFKDARWRPIGLPDTMYDSDNLMAVPSDEVQCQKDPHAMGATYKRRIIPSENDPRFPALNKNRATITVSPSTKQ